MNTGEEGGVWKEDQREGTFKKNQNRTWGPDLSLAAPVFLPEALPPPPFSSCPEQNRRSPSSRGGPNKRLHTGGGWGGGRDSVSLRSFQIVENLIVLLLFTCHSAQVSVSLSVVAPLTLPPCPLQSLTEGCVRPCVFPCVCVSSIRRLIE